MINYLIEEKAEKLLIDANCFTIPVDLQKCCNFFNVNVAAVDLEEEVSGFLVFKGNNTPHIGYNQNEGESRSRFTIAHELGHFFLHGKDAPVYIDKKNKTYYRNSISATGESLKEREANSFAAALLMPRKLVLKAVQELKEEERPSMTRALARKFNVSPNAMNIRLVNLGIVDY
jgi:Zn-dependent peptidase ImmA (M78 family)